MPARRSAAQRPAKTSRSAAPDSTDSTWGPASLAGQTQSGDWSPDEVRALLREYGIAPSSIDANPLPGGWENLNLRLDVEVDLDGDLDIHLKAVNTRYVLRRYDSTPPAEVPWELELLTFLAKGGFPSPAPLRRSDGGLLTPFRERPAALFPFVDGRHPKWDEPHAPIVAAEAIGRLHQLTHGLTLRHPRSRQEAHARLKRFHTWLTERPPTEADARAGADAGQDAPLRAFAREARRHEAEFLRRLEDVERTLGPLPRGVVHADAHGNNLLVDPDDPTRLIALIDFDDAHESLLLTDVCSLVDIWGVDRRTYEHDPTRARRALETYTAFRLLTPPERELFPDVLALLNLAGTTSYVTGRIKGGADPAQALADCGQYKSFRRRTAGPAWRETLREILLG